MQGRLTAAWYPRPVNVFRAAVRVSTSLVVLLSTSAIALARTPARSATPVTAVVARAVAAPVTRAGAEAYALGRMLELEGSLPEALVQLRRAAEESPQDPYVRLELATAEGRIGRGDEALAAV